MQQVLFTHQTPTGNTIHVVYQRAELGTSAGEERILVSTYVGRLPLRNIEKVRREWSRHFYDALYSAACDMLDLGPWEGVDKALAATLPLHYTMDRRLLWSLKYQEWEEFLGVVYAIKAGRHEDAMEVVAQEVTEAA